MKFISMNNVEYMLRTQSCIKKRKQSWNIFVVSFRLFECKIVLISHQNKNSKEFYTKFIKNEEDFSSSNDVASESNDVSNHTSLLQNNDQVDGNFNLLQNPSGNESIYPANLVEEANKET